ncbi:DUF4157 domain-containing protein [Flavobacterium sp. DG2-3]|uniref:eCIS core domain-containing protein n=1 Tax=Flavobacterium sp. DG2-3 TaxID=3068317 RepID=UPI00273E24DD|nr:DUF4157 domain-containing protein [Flavobacterium sp. DG2-3]MDP5199814.1 DUF4157 domain-containing protein [Flavobacterium sp. DG2-3]
MDNKTIHTEDTKQQFSAANSIQKKDNTQSAVSLQDNRPKSVLQKKENNTGLPDHLKSGIENLSGHSMDDVKVHYNSDKPGQLNAHAYAQGSDIHLASGQEKHLPHEAWHVVQQKQGRVKPTLQMKGKVNVNDNKGLENEADVMGAKAMQLKNNPNEKKIIQKEIRHNTISQRMITIQRKIIDSHVINRIKSHYALRNIDPIVLNILINDAIEMTDNYEAAIERINNGIMHDNAMTAPVENTEDGAKTDKKISKRAAIDISDTRTRPVFTSSVPLAATSKTKLEEEWKGSNTKDFYSKVRGLLKIARDPVHKDNKEAIKKLDELINGYKEHESVKKLIDNAVRVKATKAKGASSGTGLDELFKTSETMKYLELSYRPPKKMSAVATFDGEEFDWMDAQEQIRLSTEFIIWAGDLVDEISGHTGTFQKKYQRNWMTQKQSVMHEVRDDAISKRSNPATGIVEAIATHLRITENVEGLIKEKYTGVKASDALTSDGHSVDERYDEILKDLHKHRDVLKSYLQVFRKKAVVSGNSSPLIARHGGSDYHPESPMHMGIDDVEIKSNGKVNGNPLYNLASQWRKTHGSPAKKIPPKPIHPAITEAREFIKKKWSTTKATSINTAAKRQAKKLGEDADPSEVDKEMIRIYIEKLDPDKSDKEVEDIIEKLITAQEELSQ